MYITKEDEQKYLNELKKLPKEERQEYVNLVLSKLRLEEEREQAKQYLHKAFLKIDMMSAVPMN